MTRPVVKYVEPSAFSEYGWKCLGRCTGCRNTVKYIFVHDEIKKYVIHHYLYYAMFEATYDNGLVKEKTPISQLNNYLQYLKDNNV